MLDGLHATGHDIACVVTRAPARRGRGGNASPTPAHAAAERLGVPVLHDPAGALSRGAELGVVVAYGRLISAEVLAELPCVNVHFSLLPRWRGAAPVERAILAGDAVTGACLMEVVPELDAGGIYASATVVIGEREHAHTLAVRLAEAGLALLLDALAGGPGGGDPAGLGGTGPAGLGVPVPQRGEVTWAPKLAKDELRLDWERPATELARVVRAGPAWTVVAGRRLGVVEARAQEVAPGVVEAHAETVGPAVHPAVPGTVRPASGGLAVSCGEASVLAIEEVKPEGRRAMPAAEWWRGARLGEGTVLGT